MAAHRVLIIDDEPVILKMLGEVLTRAGYDVEAAATGAEGLTAFLQRLPDCTIIDKTLPDTDGITLLGQMRIRDPDAQVMMLTGYPTLDSAVEALHLGAADYIMKPLTSLDLLSAKVAKAIEIRHGATERRRLVSELVRANEDLREERERLRRSYLDTIEAMVNALEARDRYTVGHSERVAVYASRIALALALSPADVERVTHAALLHDVGKIGVCEGILNKPGLLNEREWEDMRRHPVIGCELLAHGALFAEVIPGVRSHHERIDGEGYPDRLAGSRIPLAARVISVADTYDALTSDRPYRRRCPPGEAAAIIEAVAGPQLDPEFVEVFTRLMQSGELYRGGPRGRLQLIRGG
ncbi:MAG TPA: HD domain-containing phosphohydrolase [Myxococcota bacterium]|jgi:putative nucleotidyltransferase with HDIG domain|nr:HD domain-containing phosphohydrolase [Myxococcota bacterium]